MTSCTGCAVILRFVVHFLITLTYTVACNWLAHLEIPVYISLIQSVAISEMFITPKCYCNYIGIWGLSIVILLNYVVNDRTCNHRSLLFLILLSINPEIRNANAHRLIWGIIHVCIANGAGKVTCMYSIWHIIYKTTGQIAHIHVNEQHRTMPLFNKYLIQREGACWNFLNTITTKNTTKCN